MKNIWTGKRERKFSAAPLLIFGVGAVFTLIALSNSRSANEELRQSSIKESISKAAALCYAAEGAYPESLDYLEDNYGVRTEYDNFTVHYSYAGGNIPPDIIVTPKTKG
ncbi:hypothetical protein [Huintestinicola sp.]|uniref:hypothetical protein n=1 Tax=Huintestinicola sp. TaxID=2981661 RepID=UPI003D7C6A81